MGSAGAGFLGGCSTCGWLEEGDGTVQWGHGVSNANREREGKRTSACWAVAAALASKLKLGPGSSSGAASYKNREGAGRLADFSAKNRPNERKEGERKKNYLSFTFLNSVFKPI